MMGRRWTESFFWMGYTVSENQYYYSGERRYSPVRYSRPNEDLSEPAPVLPVIRWIRPSLYYLAQSHWCNVLRRAVLSSSYIGETGGQAPGGIVRKGGARLWSDHQNRGARSRGIGRRHCSHTNGLRNRTYWRCSWYAVLQLRRHRGRLNRRLVRMASSRLCGSEHGEIYHMRLSMTFQAYRLHHS